MSRPVLPAPRDKASSVKGMFDSIAPRYDLVNRVMTFGLDIRWRRLAVEGLNLAEGSVVADLACGTGDFCHEIRRFGYRAIGFDFSSGMLANARTAAPLVMADVLSLPLRSESVDGVTCGFAMRNVTDLDALFREVNRVLKPTGRFVLLEVDVPKAAAVRQTHRIYFNKLVPLIGGVLSDRRAYSYLPQSVAYLPDHSQLLAKMEAAGLGDLRKRTVGLGAAQILSGGRS